VVGAAAGECIVRFVIPRPRTFARELRDRCTSITASAHSLPVNYTNTCRYVELVDTLSRATFPQVKSTQLVHRTPHRHVRFPHILGQRMAQCQKGSSFFENTHTYRCTACGIDDLETLFHTTAFQPLLPLSLPWPATRYSTTLPFPYPTSAAGAIASI
jgi:hypothetical protein